MSLETPNKIRMLQRKLYLKAKAEPKYRFYLLYDKVYREDVLEHAYVLAKANKGAPGWTGKHSRGLKYKGEGNGWQVLGRNYMPRVYRRVRDFLVRRHGVQSRGTRRFSYEVVYGELGVLRLRRIHLGPLPNALR
jgi:hypothetical protein